MSKVVNTNLVKIKELEKPDDCSICLEKLGDEKSQSCGHYFHQECLVKHFKPECPLCRTKLNIKVTGNNILSDLRDYIIENGFSLNQNSRDNSVSRDSDYDRELFDRELFNSEEIDSEDEYRENYRERDYDFQDRGYNFPDEDPEYDEENPDNYY
jgi:hypothetical protein